ncbi:MULTISPECIES: LysE family transporter [unclassified Croceitalea]|uniref:LysE family transporter n=1 Tax=unclassified Croceitalea TaxID=2632280 RepID=UPI0030DD366F
MVANLKVLVAGLLISFLGALPLGSLNITAFDISASQNVQNALLFSFAAIFIELIYVRLTLWGSQKVKLNSKWIYLLLPLGVLLLLYLAISSFITAVHIEDIATSKSILPKITSPILLGLLLSALNPLQVPFWLTWNKVLESKKILKHNTSSFTSYMFGIGAGTLTGLIVFIFAGKLIVTGYGQYAQISNFILGLLYLGFSFYLLFLLFKKRHQFKIQ